MTMQIERGSWWRFMARVLVMGAVIFGAVRLAVARDGVAGGPARSYLTVSGTLTGVDGGAPTTFTFRNAAGVTCTPPTVTITPTAGTDSFSAEINTETCSSALFDGSNVTVSVSVGGVGVVDGGTVNPVPYAVYASQYGTPECPVGYEHNTTDATVGRGNILCQKHRIADGVIYDEVVRVGTGATAFWIDRYEATVWSDIATRVGLDGAGTGEDAAWGASAPNYGPGFPSNGQWNNPVPAHPTPMYALSLVGRRPSRFITWFQAMEACRLNGKRLPSGEEWLTAAQGTPDPTAGNDGAMNSLCNTAGAIVRVTGRGTGCASAWGAQDMIGNVSEWTSEWYAGAFTDDSRDARTSTTSPPSWPAGYNDDATSNIAGVVYATRGSTRTAALPAAVVHGGDYGAGANAGVFAFHMVSGPSNSGVTVGFRCVIPR